jgi:hypothetical protein
MSCSPGKASWTQIISPRGLKFLPIALDPKDEISSYKAADPSSQASGIGWKRPGRTHQSD